MQMELDEEDDSPVAEWFYDHRALQFTDRVNGPSYKSWRLSLPEMNALYRFAGQLLSDLLDSNYFYLFEPQALITAKSLNLCIPGGPKFEPMYRCDCLVFCVVIALNFVSERSHVLGPAIFVEDPGTCTVF